MVCQWSGCLVPVSSFCEPKGRSPAVWHWFALNGEWAIPLFAFAAIWRSFHGPLKKNRESVDVDVFAFLNTTPNELVATVHPSRMPVLMADEAAYRTWLSGSPDEAFELVRPFPADQMKIVKSGSERSDGGERFKSNRLTRGEFSHRAPAIAGHAEMSAPFE